MRARLIGSSVYVGLCGLLALGGVVVAMTFSSDPDAPLFVGLGLGLGATCALCGLVGVPSLRSALGWRRVVAAWRADPRPPRPAHTWEVVVRGDRADGPDVVLRDGLPVLHVTRAADGGYGRCRLEAADRALRFRSVRSELAVLDGRTVLGAAEQVGGQLGAYLVLRVGESGLVPTGAMHRTVWDAVDRSGVDRTLTFSPLPALDGDGEATALTAELPDDGDPAAWAAMLWFLVYRRTVYIAVNQRIAAAADSAASAV